MEIKLLPINQVVENPDNPRRKLGDLSSLVASIAKIGLVEPIVVRLLEGGQYVIVSGARRHAACKKLGFEFIPSVVRASDENEALVSIAENTAREDLSVDELADAVNRLDGLAMTDEEISAALAITASDVSAARTVSKASKRVKTSIKALQPEHRQFTLEESAALVSQSGNERRLRELADCLDWEPAQLPHVLARFDAEDEQQKVLDDLLASVKGCIEIKPFPHYGRPQAGAEPLHNLTTGDGKKLTATAHKNCPNRAYLLVNDRKTPRVVDYCADWESSGHKLSETPKQVWPSFKRAEGSTGESDADREAKTQQRREVIANNKAWATASTVRKNWVYQFALHKELPHSAKQWVLNEIILDPTHISAANWQGTINGLDQAFIVVWTQLSASREVLLSQHTWRPASWIRPVLERYMAMLKLQGYPVSEVESRLIVEKNPGVHDAA